MTARTVLITGARAPVALHLARLLSAAGHRVLTADTFAHPLAAASRCVATHLQLPPPRQAFAAYQTALSRVIHDHSIDLILPTCEEVFYLAQADLPAPVLAPNIKTLARMHNKHAFINLCAEAGLPAPETHLLETQADLEAIAPRAQDVVFKPVWSRFASRVLIRPKPRALRRVQPSATAPWVAQRFVEGDEISLYALAHGGRLVGLSAYRALYRAGPGAAVCFAPVEDPGLAPFADRVIEATGWSGQISFDLIRTPSGQLLPLECNPRATSGLHFFSDGPAFAAALLSGQPVAPDVTCPQGVRLALWVYGLPSAIAARDLARFRRTLSDVQDVLASPDDPGPARAQIRALSEIAGVALRQRTSLQRASTHDIEWDGWSDEG